MGTGTGIGRVRGLGSAKAGAHHWIVQRFTAVGNVILFPWLILSLAVLPSHDHATVIAWLAQPLVAVPMVLLLINIAIHLRSGLQVVIEDYVHHDGSKFGLLVLLNFYAIALAAFGIFAILKIAFTGAPA